MRAVPSVVIVALLALLDPPTSWSCAAGYSLKTSRVTSATTPQQSKLISSTINFHSTVNSKCIYGIYWEEIRFFLVENLAGETGASSAWRLIGGFDLSGTLL